MSGVLSYAICFRWGSLAFIILFALLSITASIDAKVLLSEYSKAECQRWCSLAWHKLPVVTEAELTCPWARSSAPGEFAGLSHLLETDDSFHIVVVVVVVRLLLIAGLAGLLSMAVGNGLDGTTPIYRHAGYLSSIWGIPCICVRPVVVPDAYGCSPSASRTNCCQSLSPVPTHRAFTASSLALTSAILLVPGAAAGLDSLSPSFRVSRRGLWVWLCGGQQWGARL